MSMANSSLVVMSHNPRRNIESIAAAVAEGRFDDAQLVIDQACSSFEQDAKRYRHLRELPIVQAQAFFWNFPSRKERDKAIDRDIAATEQRHG